MEATTVDELNKKLFELLREPLHLSENCRKFTLDVEIGHLPQVEEHHDLVPSGVSVLTNRELQINGDVLEH